MVRSPQLHRPYFTVEFISKWRPTCNLFSTATSWRQRSTIFYWIIKKPCPGLAEMFANKMLLETIKNSTETLVAIISLKIFLPIRQKICNCEWNNDHRKTILDLLESPFSAVGPI